MTATAANLFLQNNLKKFGLNPTEWRLRQLHDASYEISHIHDAAFYFLGEVDTTARIPSWTTLILASF